MNDTPFLHRHRARWQRLVRLERELRRLILCAPIHRSERVAVKSWRRRLRTVRRERYEIENDFPQFEREHVA